VSFFQPHIVIVNARLHDSGRLAVTPVITSYRPSQADSESPLADHTSTICRKWVTPAFTGLICVQNPWTRCTLARFTKWQGSGWVPVGLTDFNSAGVRPSACAEGSTPLHSRQYNMGVSKEKPGQNDRTDWWIV